jgi:CRISPR-associated protein Csx17
MISIMSRRIQNSIQSGSSTWTDRGRICPEIGDVCDFIEGRVDVQRMADLFMGFILVNWRFVRKDAVKGRSISQSVYPGAGYGLLKQCFAGCDIRDVKVPIEPEIFRRAAIGDSSTAIRLAARRLRGSGLSPSIAVMSISEERMKRTAAALLFPLTESQTEMIADKVLRPEFQ